MDNNKKQIEIQEGSYKPFAVKAVRQGKKFCEVVSVQKPVKQGVKKISKDHYVVLNTGEIKEYTHTDTKQRDSLKKTFNKLRGLIRTNFDEYSKNQLFITLTYAENMKDKVKLYTDFDKFYKRLKYAYKDYKFEYIAVAEPQGRGAWHLHVMLKAVNVDSLYIDNRDISKLWGHGMTDTERLKSDDVGSYYVAYFTDMLFVDEDNPNNKAYVKGTRLSFYPKGFNFYRCSRGIKRPVEEMVELEEIEKEYGKPVYEKSLVVVEDDGKMERTINEIYRATFKKQK